DLFDDWIFSREYIRKGNSTIERRLDRLAAEIVTAARNSEADELLVIGHSLGAVIAVDLLDRALRLDGSLGASRIPVVLITIGSSAETISERCTITSCSYAGLFQPGLRRSLQTEPFR